jgi:hypothetical protein
MRDLIKKIIREEAEVKEMGLSMRKVRASQPKNYLVKSLIDKEKSEESRSELKKMVKKCNNLYSEIDSELRNIKWEDINFYEPNKFFYVMLPKNITNKMKEMTELYEELNKNGYTNGLNPLSKIAQMAADYREFIETIWIYMYTDQPRNRTHFPVGLPKSLLGYNLGVKIYRSLLHKLGFIQSAENATNAVQEVFRRLLEMPDINAVVYDDSVLLIEDGLPKSKVIEIVTDSIYERYLTKKNRRKLVLNRSIIVSSKLLKLIGETRLLNMMYELFYSAKKENREPFEKIGYKSPKSDEPE